jgi:hypothetical protein
LIWSAITPKDYLTWLLEVFPARIGLIILIATRKTLMFGTRKQIWLWSALFARCCSAPNGTISNCGSILDEPQHQQFYGNPSR